VSGTTAFTVSNTGVTSLAGSGVSVSAATGAVTVTAPTVTGGTGISVSGSGTTSLTVSATGVQSLTAGTGISVSGTTTPTVTNSGVTSIVAGTNVTVSGATGAVTINAPGFATPGSSAIGDTAAVGTATTVSRSDHVHGREAAGTPGASAVGDTASAGSATTVARSDHRHSREAFGTPVNIDASLTSLSAGSLTTVARADHVHTVSNAMVLFGTATLSSSAASITISNIPSTHSVLYLVYTIKSLNPTTVSNVDIRFNGDTSSIYCDVYGSGTFTGTYCFAGFSHGSTNSSATGAPTTCTVTNYSVSQHKTVSGLYFANNTSTANAWAGASGVINLGNYRSNNTITSITLLDRNGYNFASGSIVKVYGQP
jgi:hypothetical protein